MNYKQFLFFVLCFFSLQNILAQNFQWGKGFGTGQEETRVFDLACDDSGNVYTTGFFEGSVDFDPGPGTFNLSALGIGKDIYIQKLDSTGAFQWAVRMGGDNPAADTPRSLVVDNAGNVYSTGEFSGAADFDPGPGVFTLPTGNNFGKEIYIQKLDAQGNFVWAKSIGGTGTDAGYSIARDNNGNIFVTGIFNGLTDFDPGVGVFNLDGSNDIFVLKLDSMGDFLWAISANSSDTNGLFNRGNALATDPLGNIYITGVFTDSIDFDPDTSTYYLYSSHNNSAFMLKLDSSSNFIWAKYIDGKSGVEDMVADSLGNIYLAGYFGSSNPPGSIDLDPGPGVHNIAYSSLDIFFEKLDSAGNMVWVKTIQAPGSEIAYSIDLGDNGNIYSTGSFHGPADFDPGVGVYILNSVGSNAFVLNLENDGTFVWAESLGGVSAQVGKGIGVCEHNKINIAGEFNWSIDVDPTIDQHTLSGNIHNGFVTRWGDCQNTDTSMTVSSCGYFLSPSGDTHTTSGVFVDTILNVGGCDSMITVDLTIKNPYFSTDTITTCNNYLSPWGDTLYISGVYSDTSIAQNGCDSVTTVDVTINVSTNSLITLIVCDSFISPSGNVYNTSGVYNDTILNQAGCDSAIMIDLTVNYSSPITYQEAVACDTFTFQGTLLTVSGQYIAILTNQFGCDSIIELDLMVHYSFDTTYSDTACGFYIFNGNVINNSGTYTDTLLTPNGCDSVITVELTIYQNNGVIVLDTTCTEYVFNGDTLTESGDYYDTLTNQYGCDSIVALVLTIGSIDTTNILAAACNWFDFNGDTLTSSGIYQQNYFNQFGCDSTVILDLVVNTIDSTVSQMGLTLTANQDSVFYQWVYCNGVNTPVVGEVFQSFTPQFNGAYAVILNDDNCEVISGCHTIVGVGIDELSASNVAYYPNPTNGNLTIDFGKHYLEMKIEVRNTLGQLVVLREVHNSNTAEVELVGDSGIYIFLLYSEKEQVSTFKVLKH